MSAVSASVDRLTVEAGKYLGLTAGETIEKQEVVLQAEAEGYTSQEAHGMLEGKGQTIEIPEQRDVFGDIWPGNLSNDLITHPENTVSPVESFIQWIDKKRMQNVQPKQGDDGRMYPVWHNPQHNWSHWQARKNFGKHKDAERYCWQEWDEFTTVHVVRTADDSDAPLLEQTETMTPKAYYESRRRLLKRLSSGDYAALEIYAPKYSATHAESTVRTHAHEEYLIPGHHSLDTFDVLIDQHMDKVPGATSVHVSVQHHSDESPDRPATHAESTVWSDYTPTLVKHHSTPDSYQGAKHGLDAERGMTTGLPHELAGENQPLMNTQTDALDIHDTRAVEWMATLSASHDGEHTEPGKSYWTELGNFSEYAETMKDRREKSDNSDDLITHPEKTVSPVDEQKSSPDTNIMQSSPETIEPRIERQFINDYCDEIGNLSPSCIRQNVEDNAKLLDASHTEQIVAICRGNLTQSQNCQRERLLQAVSKLTQIPTPERAAKTADISVFRGVHEGISRLSI